MRDNQHTVIVVHRGTPGLVAGICGCIFAVLGIFTLGFVFIPIAMVCSIMGLLRGATRWNLAGFGVSLASTILSFIGFVTSPSLLLLTGLAVAS